MKQNTVLSGRFKGKRIVLRDGAPAILLNLRQTLPLTHDNVERMQVLYIHWRPSAVNGWGRGLAGSLLGRTMQISAIRSAHRIPTFNCRFHFNDGSIALARLDEAMFHALSTALEPQ